MFKLLFKLIFLVILVIGGFVAYKVFVAGEDIQDLDIENIAEDFEEMKDQAQSKYRSLKKELAAIDWNEWKDKLGLSEEEQKKFKEDVEFVYEESEKVVEDQIAKKDKPTAPSIDRKKEDRPKATEPQTPKEKARTSEPRVSAYFEKGMKTLDEAKGYSRKSLKGSGSQAKSYSEKALKAYQKSFKELNQALKDPNLSSRHKREIEKVLPKINQQIYWTKKFSRM